MVADLGTNTVHTSVRHLHIHREDVKLGIYFLLRAIVVLIILATPNTHSKQGIVQQYTFPAWWESDDSNTVISQNDTYWKKCKHHTSKYPIVNICKSKRKISTPTIVTGVQAKNVYSCAMLQWILPAMPYYNVLHLPPLLSANWTRPVVLHSTVYHALNRE